MRSDRGKESSEKGGTALPLAEDFYTIQGEGYQTGTAAYFIRLAGCDVGCPWCDAKYTWNNFWSWSNGMDYFGKPNSWEYGLFFLPAENL